MHRAAARQPDRAPPTPASLTGLTALLGVTLPPPPLYPTAPHCNTRGLTDLGAHTVNALMDKRMIVNPDHMSQAAVDATLTLLEKRGYSGVISPHGWMDPGNWPRLWKLGGLAFPGHSNADQYVQGVGAVPAASRRRTSSAGATAPTSAGSPPSPARAR